MPDTKIDNEKLEKEKKRLELEGKRRRQVFESIMALVDPVKEKVLLKHLNVLDFNSWNEVIEERYLGKLCAFPLCSNSVVVQTGQKYHVDRKMKKIYETSSLSQKFCSENCFLQSKSIQDQLSSEPLWITGDRPEKNYIIGCTVTEIPRESKKFDIEVEFVRQEIVTRIHDLKLADHAPSDDEEVELEEFVADETKTMKEDDDNFIHSIKAFLSTKTGADNTKKCDHKEKSQAKQSKNILQDDRLNKIREKYGKSDKKKQGPQIIEAQPINPMK